jgi:hypothetical protein
LGNDDVARHGPDTLPTSGDPEGASAHHEASQGLAPSVAAVPAQPEGFAHVAAHPPREGLDLALPVGTVVGHVDIRQLRFPNPSVSVFLSGLHAQADQILRRECQQPLATTDRVFRLLRV